MDVSLNDRLRAAAMKDVIEIKQIYAAIEAGEDPDGACAEIIGGGDFQLSGFTKSALLPGYTPRTRGINNGFIFCFLAALGTWAGLVWLGVIIMRRYFL